MPEGESEGNFQQGVQVGDYAYVCPDNFDEASFKTIQRGVIGKLTKTNPVCMPELLNCNEKLQIVPVEQSRKNISIASFFDQDVQECILSKGLFISLFESERINEFFERINIKADQIKKSAEASEVIIVLDQALLNAFILAVERYAQSVDVFDIFITIISQNTTLHKLFEAHGLPLGDVINACKWIQNKHADPNELINRESELEYVFKIVQSGRKKITLVGPHGVGKTSIIKVIRNEIQDDSVSILESIEDPEKDLIDQMYEVVTISEPETNDAVRIIGLKTWEIEKQTGAYFSYKVLKQVVVLSDRYLLDTYLPSKAIDICQRAATRIYNTRRVDKLVNSEDIVKIVAEKSGLNFDDLYSLICL
ncbi:MAG: hypothetical protein ABIH21_00815 [Patescibacteria group bacterium]